jgi:DNA recombination protein RmuC
MTEILIFIGGVVFGALVVIIIQLTRKREARDIARELVCETEAEKTKDLEVFLGRVKDSLGSMSLDALKKSSEEFLKLAESRLNLQTSQVRRARGQKKLIDQTLDAMRGDIQKQDAVSSFGGPRPEI